MKKLLCPCCGAPLARCGREENYETLVEHVCDPNSMGHPRPILKCTANCALGKLIYWESGGEYYNEKAVHFGDTEKVCDIKYPYAVNSISWDIERNKMWHKAHTRRIRLPFGMIDVRFGKRPEWMVTESSPQEYCWGIEIWKRLWRSSSYAYRGKLFAHCHGTW